MSSIVAKMLLSDSLLLRSIKHIPILASGNAYTTASAAVYNCLQFAILTKVLVVAIEFACMSPYHKLIGLLAIIYRWSSAVLDGANRKKLQTN
jgi:hypothetical protein